MIFYALFNGQEQNSKKMFSWEKKQSKNNVKLYPGLPEAPSTKA